MHREKEKEKEREEVMVMSDLGMGTFLVREEEDMYTCHILSYILGP
jgi:hypothetical protein